ncbi:MAG: TPM domain-containing protein [Puniceicoccaceae bacterium]
MLLRSIQPSRLLCSIVLVLLSTALAAVELWQNLPRQDRAIHDFAEQIDARTESRLEGFLTTAFRSLDTPVVVVTLPSLQGGQIDDFANRLYEHWGIGTRPDNRGILFLIALEERQMRIETGYGTEPVITDTLAASLIRDIARPRFQQGDIAGGIEVVVRTLIGTVAEAEGKTVEGAATYRGKASERDGSGLVNVIFWIIVLISVFSGAGRRSRHLRHRSMLPLLLMSGGFRGSSRGGFGSSGSGGFGGFGGGFSGGGGASGGW